MNKSEVKRLKKDLKPGMLAFMEKKDPGKAMSTYATYVSDSNYLLNNEAVDEYIRFMRSEISEETIKTLIFNLLVEHRGIEKVTDGGKYYFEKLSWHKEYVLATGGIDSWLN